jgi:hypothetical protein
MDSRKKENIKIIDEKDKMLINYNLIISKLQNENFKSEEIKEINEK